MLFTTDVLVAAGQRHKVEGLGKACPRCNRASFTALKRSDMAAELRVDHGDFDMLNHHAANVSHRFPRVVRYNDIGRDLFAMVVDFLVQSYFQADLAVAESEALANKGAWKTSSSGSRRMLELN